VAANLLVGAYLSGRGGALGEQSAVASLPAPVDKALDTAAKRKQ